MVALRSMGRRLRVVTEIPERESLAPGMPPWPGIPVGRAVWEFKGCTYGCVADGEIAVTLKPGEPPFLGVPRDAVVDAPVEDDPFMAGIRERARQNALRMIRATLEPNSEA